MGKRILYIASINPFKTGGGSQATLAYLQSVIDIFGAENVDIMIGAENINLVTDPYKNLHFLPISKISLKKSFLNIIKLYISRFTPNIIKQIKTNPKLYKLVVINRGDVAGKAVKVLHKLGVITCVIHHNYEVEYNRDNRTLITLRGKYSGILKLIEKSAYRYSDLNLFLTSQDKFTFQKNYGKSFGRNEILGCYETKYALKPKNLFTQKEFDLSISGTMENYQTVCGIKDIDKKYLSIIKEVIKNPKILITGRNPNKEIINIINSNKEIYKIVPNPIDIFSQVIRGKIYLCPTNIGGGLKLRAMDGLKCGLPILVHYNSARGYDYFFDKPYFKVYNDRNSFFHGLTEILNYLSVTPNSCETIHKDFEKYFSYPHGTKRLKDLLLDNIVIPP